MKVITKNFFVTSDGTEFDSLSGAKEYEAGVFRKRCHEIAALLRREDPEFAPSIMKQHIEKIKKIVETYESWHCSPTQKE